jgi:hypothetical protein
MADRQLLQIKQETTEGTDAAPTATDVVWAEGVQFTPKGDRGKTTVDKPGVGPVAGKLTGQYGELTFSVPLTASGTKGTAPKWGFLAKFCGFTETIVATTSVTYGLAADPSASPSGTIAWREGRRTHKLTMARGRMGLKLDENQRPMLTFSFKGLKTAVADGAVIAQADATWTGWVDALPITQGRTTFTVAGASAPFRSLSIDQSDNVVFSDRPNQKRIDLVGERTFTGKLKCGTLLPSVLNFETLAENDTISTLALVHGATAGNIITVNARFQNGEPSYSDDKGLDVTDVDLSLVPTALNTDDDLSIALT